MITNTKKTVFLLLTLALTNGLSSVQVHQRPASPHKVDPWIELKIIGCVVGAGVGIYGLYKGGQALFEHIEYKRSSNEQLINKARKAYAEVAALYRMVIIEKDVETSADAVIYYARASGNTLNNNNGTPLHNFIEALSNQVKKYTRCVDNLKKRSLQETANEWLWTGDHKVLMVYHNICRIITTTAEYAEETRFINAQRPSSHYHYHF